MNNIKAFLLCATIMATMSVFSQNKKTKKADDNFKSHAYAIAIEDYKNLVDQGYDNTEIYKRLGDANYRNANYSEAANWYSKLFMIENATIDAKYMYKYAQSLKSSKEYEASTIWMQKYRSTKTVEERSKRFLQNPNYLENIEKNSGRYDIINLAINSKSSDFSPAFKGEQLVFSTARDTGYVSKRVHTWNNAPFTNLYTATPNANGDFTKASPLSSLNKRTHEASAIFTKDGSTVYFTRNNSSNGKFARDLNGVSRLKIYRAELKDEKWINITELPFNSDEFSVAHPALSPDEKKLYFASNMPGTLGESDIFVVAINEDGSFGTPNNLGTSINTEARETFPFISESNVLYFASDGRPGLGGLDVFAAKLNDLDDLTVLNVGKPVNSEQDDFSFIINDQTRRGFFTSNRDGGKGSDDIYAFEENKALSFKTKTVIVGITTDQDKGIPLEGAQIILLDKEGKKLSEVLTKADGSFVFDSKYNFDDYIISANGEGYEKREVSFSAENKKDTTRVEVQLKKILKRAPVGTDLAKFLNLNPVYFDLDKSVIRPDAAKTFDAVISYLNVFQDIKIQIQSHTDVKASSAYNMQLSTKRAKSTLNYLIDKGIHPDRLTSKGFGETKLVNDCVTLAKCTDERHEENRRSEFIVLK